LAIIFAGDSEPLISKAKVLLTAQSPLGEAVATFMLLDAGDSEQTKSEQKTLSFNIHNS